MRTVTLSAALLLWALGLGGAFVLAADEDPVPHPLAAARTSGTFPAEQGATHETGIETEPETAAPTGPPQALLRVGLKDFKLVPNGLVGKAGTITFHLVNEGRYTHDFRIEGEGVSTKSPKIGQGRERDWQVTLQPGTYEISCPISNHSKRGMTGTLVVK